MAEVEKILCTGEQGNDGLTTALLANGGMGGQWNNPFIYLVWMMFANRFWNNGENGGEYNAILNRVNELGSQMNTNQNTNLMMDAINGNHEALHALATNLGVSTMQLQGAINGVQNAVTQVGGQVGYSAEKVINSVLLGNKDLTAAIQNCCCNTQQNIIKMGYENQLGQKDLQNAFTSRIDQLANGIQSGFAQVGYAAQQNTQAIIQNASANTQRILDQMCANTTQELRDKLAQASQNAQTAQIIAALKTTTTPTA